MAVAIRQEGKPATVVCEVNVEVVVEVELVVDEMVETDVKPVETVFV